MIPRASARRAASLSRWASRLLAGLGCVAITGCFSTTHAEDPLPGAVQRSVVIADEGGDGSLWVIASALLPLSKEYANRWVAAAAVDGLWMGGAGRAAPQIQILSEAPGWTRVEVKDGPFPGGASGEDQADGVRKAWSDELTALRAWVAGRPDGSL